MNYINQKKNMTSPSSSRIIEHLRYTAKFFLKNIPNTLVKQEYQNKIDNAKSCDDLENIIFSIGHYEEYARGLRHIQLRALEEKATPANNANPFLKNDPSLWPFLTYYTNKTPYGDGFCPIRHENVHPVICLIKTTHLNAFQDKLAKLIRESELGEVWSTVVYNEKGITVSHPGVTEMEICDKQGVAVDGAFHFSSLSINHALQYFYDLRKAGGRVSNIAVVCGDLADRSISFVSTNYQWHLTQMYYVPPKNASVASCIQAAGRLCGKFDDNVPLALFAPPNVLDNVIKGIEIQEEAIDYNKYF